MGSVRALTWSPYQSPSGCVGKAPNTAPPVSGACTVLATSISVFPGGSGLWVNYFSHSLELGLILPVQDASLLPPTHVSLPEIKGQSVPRLLLISLLQTTIRSRLYLPVPSTRSALLNGPSSFLMMIHSVLGHGALATHFPPSSRSNNCFLPLEVRARPGTPEPRIWLGIKHMLDKAFYKE